jgi:hypothetical protein
MVAGNAEKIMLSWIDFPNWDSCQNQGKSSLPYYRQVINFNHSKVVEINCGNHPNAWRYFEVRICWSAAV